MITLNRRTFLTAGSIATLGAVTGLGTQMSLAAPGVPSDGDVVVLLFLRGGADGLSLTPPIRDSAYYDLRPQIAIPQPGQANGALPLTANGAVTYSAGFEGAFALHPAAKALHDGLWADGKLAFIPGAGFKDTTQSHFTATWNNYRGSLSLNVRGGWLGRMTSVQGGPGPLPSVHDSGARQGTAGGPGTMGIVPSLNQFSGGTFRDARKAALLASHGGDDSVSAMGRHLLSLSDGLGALQGGAREGYNDDAYGKRFSELAQLLRADPPFGIRAAAIDVGKWDHHKDLGRPGDADGAFHRQTKEMCDAIQAFADETNGLEGITLVVASEFGRTTNENGNLGTDHGEGFTMMVAGGGIKGGVYGDDFADSLALPQGRRRGSVPVATDYRKPISELIRKRAKVDDIAGIFPDFAPAGADLGLA